MNLNQPNERATKVTQVLTLYRQLRDHDLAEFALHLDQASDAEIDEWTSVAIKMFLEMNLKNATTPV